MDKLVGNLMRAALMECCSPQLVERIVAHSMFEEASKPEPKPKQRRLCRKVFPL
ncbi:hypothetical protein ACLBT1_22785, partial [Pseudomonas aeruginosa]